MTQADVFANKQLSSKILHSNKATRHRCVLGRRYCKWF